MKKFITIMSFVVVAIWITACGPATTGPSNNTNAGNTNANKPTAAAPTADSLMAKEKEANDAYFKGDSKYFEQIFADKFRMMGPDHKWMDRAASLKMIGEVKCEVKSFDLTEPALTMINPDTAVIIYKGTVDGSCAEGDKEKMAVPSPTRAVSIWTREGGKWLAVFHGENLIIDPKNPPKSPPAAPAKKDEAQSETPKSANADALVKVHQAGWEAFKNKDAKWFNENMAANFVGVNPMGGILSSKADTIKAWTETMKCEGITKTSVTDGSSVSLSPTLELFSLKGNADGTCDGQKNGDLYQTTLYIKEGEGWKLAFMFESM